MRPSTVLVVAALLAAAVAPARADVRCAAVRRGDRVLLDVRLERLFDRELLRLVRLGLAGRLRVRATLFRRRDYWFDDERAARTIESVVTFAPPGRFLLDGEREVDPGAIELPRLSLGAGRVGGGAHYV